MNFFDTVQAGDYENDFFYQTAATFKIKNSPNDVYKAVGELIWLSQELEESFKKLTELLHLPVKNIDGSSLNKLNDALKKNGKITEKQFEKLQRVIEARNYLNHSFFLNDFREPDEKISERTLNYFRYVICEATDFISNRLDELNKKGSFPYVPRRPNIIENE